MSEPDAPPETKPPIPWVRASLTDAAEVNFEKPIAEMKTADCLGLTLKYRDAGQVKTDAGEITDSPDTRIFTMLWAITGMHFKPNELNEPFGPMMTLTDGSRSAIPTDYRGAPIEVVAWMAERATSPALRARLCDICWLLDRKRSALGTLAITSYVELVRQVEKKALSFSFHQTDEDQAISHDACGLLRRALQIGRATGWDKQEVGAARKFVEDLRIKASTVVSGIPMLWFSGLDLDFGVSNPLDVAVEVENLLKNPDAGGASRGDLWLLAARAYHLAKKADDKNRCQGEAAEFLVSEAERNDHSAMMASHWLSMAIRQFHGVPGMKDRRTALRHRLVDTQSRILEEMSQFSQELDVKEIAERVKEEIEKATLLDKMLILADLARSPDPTTLREEATQAIAKHPLSSIFGTTHLDSEGKVIHRTEGGLDDNEGAIERQIAQSEKIRRHIAVAGSIGPARQAIIDRHLISDDVLMSLFKFSPFVPPYLLVTFSRGFTRFFEGDFISALYTLTPLLENSLRHVLKAYGHDVTIFDDAEGTQEDRTISALFEKMRSEMESIFSKAIIADIDRVFLKKTGPSVRHGVAHGLLHDGSAFTTDTVYACWLIFRLCCAPLFAQKSNIEIVAA